MNVSPVKIIFGLLVVLLVIYTNASAQVDGTSSPQTRETANKADQNLKSIAHVNPSTLAMEMNLPLMTYPGRNGSSLPVGFSYSSKLWRMQGGVPWWYWVNTHKKYVTDIHTVFAEKTAGGWTSNLVPPRLEEKTQVYDENGQPYNPVIDEAGLNTAWENALSSFSSASLLDSCQGFFCCTTYWCSPMGGGYLCTCTRWVQIEIGGGGSGNPPPPPPTPMQLYYVRKFQVSMPDGATYEFRSSDNPIHCGNTNTGCPISGTGNGTYLSVDGSGMRLVKDGDGTTLFLPNGGRYVFPPTSPNPNSGNYATTFFDPNSNKLAFVSSTNPSPGQTTNKWIDSLGREITDPMPHNMGVQRQSPGTKDFSLPGLNGQPQNYSMTSVHLKPLGCETSTDPNCVGEGNVVGGALEDQSQKLFYETRYLCRGNLITDLLVNPNNVNDPANEVLFPLKDIGVRPCNSFNVQRDANGEIVLDGDGLAIPYATRFNPVVLTEVELPNGKKYEFKYNRFGEITKITYPTGSYETFTFAKLTPVAGVENIGFDQTNRGVVERRVYNASGGLEQRWTYSAGLWGASYIVTTTSPSEDDPLGSGSRTERHLHPAGSAGNNFGFDSPLGGMPYEEKTYAENDYVNPRSRNLTEWITKNNGAVSRDPRVKRTVSITIENGQALATLSETEYDETGHADPEYFSHLNAKRSKSHHFRNIPLSLAQTGTIQQIASYFSSATVAAISETDYAYDAGYKARGISSLPVESRTLDPADNSVLAKTQTIYDNQLPASSANYPAVYSIENYGIAMSFDCSDDSQTPKICWENPNSSYLGKPTTSRLWDSDNNTWIETHTRYDIFGNAIAARDPIGNETTTLFENSVQKPYRYAYPTRVDTPAPDPTNTHGTNEGSYSTSTYDFMTGLPLTATDEFGQTTATEYNDPLLRPTRAYAVNFTAPETQTIYDDNALTVKVRKQIDATNWDEATTFMDSLGRAIKTQAMDSQGDVFVETKYDFLGRVSEVSNPYRSGDTVLWSKTIYDELGRAEESFAPAPSGQTGDSLGTTAYDISTAPGFLGMVVTTTDAAGKKGRSITNALGQLIVVDEPDHTGQVLPIPQSTPNPLPTPTPTPGGGDPNCPPPYRHCVPELLVDSEYPSHSTIYRYNAQGKMVEVTQGVQKRYFKYDSLGRLIRVRQPEQEINPALNLADEYNTSGQWTAGFTYDVLGNVLTATDANGVTITNTYDRAGRVKTRNYSGEPAGQTTPAVSFYYDGKGLAQTQNPNFAKGKLTSAASSVSETQYALFDNFGRLKESRQITDGQTYTSKYTYNFAGALVEEEYPSGRKVKNEFESDGDLLNVTSKKAGSDVFSPYVSNFSYTASGGISQMKLGNGKWETAKFNTRLQVTELGLGNSAVDASLWKVNYEYGELNTDGTVNTAKNTGNIARQSLSFTGLAQPFVQSYKYDSLYRLTEARETANGQQNWIQNFGYDRYGNRTSFNQTVLSQQTTTTPTIDVNTNRFTTGQGFVYDLNGNLVTDAEGRQFTFNGDNKQTVVKDASNNIIGQYFYDGEGKRVKKITNTETTTFVYSAGKLIAEYSTQLSQNPTISYTTTDHLGSPRIITDALGQVKSRRDFMPFGEDLFNGVGPRTESLKYGVSADDIRQKFTGYQKDSETGLDFAEARMYENRYARFTAVDPLLASGKSANPQTFNRYVYVGNNPLNITDPLGLDWWHLFNKNSNTRSIFWSTEMPEAGEGETVSKWENYVYKADDNYWYSLDPNSDQSSRWYTQERAEWDNGAYTNYKGYGSIPIYGDFLLPMISGIKTGNVERAIYGFEGLSLTFATAPRTIGGLLKEGAQEAFSSLSGLPIFNFRKPLSNENLVQKAANIAENKIGGIGAVPGTLKHKNAQNLIERYQRRFGDRGLELEKSWLNGGRVDYGTKGSVRFDVFDTTNGTVYDFKFTRNLPGLRQSRINQMFSNGPNTIRTIEEINPR